MLRICVFQLKQQSKLVWTFIVDREVEAPARFRAIQTYRAATAIAQQQVRAEDCCIPNLTGLQLTPYCSRLPPMKMHIGACGLHPFSVMLPTDHQGCCCCHRQHAIQRTELYCSSPLISVDTASHVILPKPGC